MEILFRVENGILSVRYDQYDSFNCKFGALYYNKKFSNYRLKVEYRFIGELTKGAPSWGFRDSGVLKTSCKMPVTNYRIPLRDFSTGNWQLIFNITPSDL